MKKNYIDDTLETRLHQLKLSYSEPIYIKSDKLIALAKSNLRIITHYYHAIMPYDKTTGTDRVFFDSYYRLEQMLEHVVRALHNVYLPCSEADRLPNFYHYLDTAIRTETFEVNTQSIIDLIDLYEQKQYLKSIEFDFISIYIKIIITSIVVDFIKEKLRNKDVFEGAIKAIYAVQSVDIEYIIKIKNRLEMLLASEEANIYISQTDKTKQHYRYMITKISRIINVDELLLTRKLMQLAEKSEHEKHIGFQIYSEYEKCIDKKTRQKLHLKALYITSAFASVLVAWLSGYWYLAPILYFPMVELIRPFVEYFIQKGNEHDYAPRMNFDGIVPDEYKTLVVVSTLLPEIKELSSFKTKLEKLLLSNRKGAISYVVLADLKQETTVTVSSDREKLSGADKVINELNRLYQNNILLLVRKREYSKTQNCYSGRERKRGAISDLVSLIQGNKIELQHSCGSEAILDEAKYILALDYDTTLLLDSVVEFVQVAAHPLNQPVVDKERAVVTRGYGVIAPKITLDLKDSLKTYFTRIIGGIGGTACYDMDCAELYQDLYGEGIFTGKGLIDVQAYYQVLEEKFESETVLSHDILEGGFLRTRFVGDIEVVDGMPTNATAYFKRLHRWIRGDYQNSAFLFNTIKNDRQKVRNPLSKLDKYKIFDNLRRAITPAFVLLCVFLAGFLSKSFALIFFVVALLAVIIPYAFSITMQILNGHTLAITTKSFSNTMTTLNQELARMGSEILLIPQYAYIGLDASIRGLFRRFISKKNMLEWTTAAQVQNQSNRFLNELMYYMPCILSGILLILSKSIIIKAMGILFLLAIPFVFLTKQDSKILTTNIYKTARKELIKDLQSMLLFYNDYCNDENHYLPPDNVQKAPVFRIAHRTSPTNIGLMLLSMLTARDFDLITSDRLCNYVSLTIKTAEQLQKFNGNLYNWYDTKTREVLQPYYVSTVDSGNFVCCLVSLKEGLKEYEIENTGISSLIERIETLINQTDLSCFYDEKKKLFSIGFDSQNNELSHSYYDMLMSEARMTSYFAIAKGQVPKKHWGALSRIQSRQSGHTGPMSWTGTMFEFFMPELLLHCIRGSLGYEGLAYCLQCQKNRVKKLDMPYGISESAIYEFDGYLNYQYKANGVQRVALKQGMNDELVISPYSTYLTLSFDFNDAYENLLRLKKLRINGEYGLYEALDYTKKRIGENKFIPIQSYMAHHLGMSIIAINNALNQNIMQKRFLRDIDMCRATELLYEKMRVGNVMLADQIKREKMPKKENKEDIEAFVGELYPNNPRVKLLSNNKLTSVLTDLGSSFLQVNHTDITRRTTDLLRNALGTFCYIKLNQEIMSLTYAPSYQDKYHYETSTTKGSIQFYAQSEMIKSKIEVSMHRTLPCEQRIISITNCSTKELKTSMILYMEPALFPYLDDATHKAFSKLFINVQYDKSKNIVLVTRKKRANEEIYYLAIGLREEETIEIEANRENVFENGDINAVKLNTFTDEFDNSTGVPDPCVALRIPLNLKHNERKTMTLITSVADNKDDAIDHILALRECDVVDSETSAKSKFISGSLAERIAQTIVPQVLYHKRDSTLNLEAIANNKIGKNGLWEISISGDLPIVLVDILNETDIQRVEAYSLCHSLLKLSWIEYDLVFVYDGTQEKTRDVLEEIVRKNCGESVIGQKGGVYFVNKDLINTHLQNLLLAVACHIATRSLVHIEAPMTKYTPILIQAVQKAVPNMANAFEVYQGAFSNDSFFVTGQPQLPWCHILSNPTFGSVLSDKSLGFTWAINARENKLTPWSNDTLKDNDGERILMRYQDKYYDIIRGSCAQFNPKFVDYHGECAGLKTNVYVTVPSRGMIKYIEVTVTNETNEPQEVDLCYYTEPTINVSRDSSKMICGELVSSTLLLHNPFNLMGHAFMGLTVYENSFDFTCDRISFFSGKWDSNQLPPTIDLCSALTVKKTIKPGASCKLIFSLCFATSKKGVLEQIKIKPNEEYFPENSLRVNTGDRTIDELVNTWLPHQMVSSRIYGRTGFYQCGGAYGFRDQLQDVLSYLILSPKLAKTHILRCCASQFEQGDVFHWWHSMPKFGGGKKGVRTRYSDDLVWLPYVVSEYVIQTGDMSILDIKVPFLVAEEIPDGQKDSYIEAVYSHDKGTVFEHCKRALERSFRLGEHNLPKMGSGDWNDGYSKVGAKGDGESVWLAQFIALTMNRLANVCEMMNKFDIAKEYQIKASELLKAVDEFCFDQDHYIRAFYDNGERMGAYQSDECKVDSLTQSFSAIADMPNKQRVKIGLETAYNMLVDEKYGIIKLFAPAFDKSMQEPGYVKAYPKGVRENGGQYTHASVWFAIAMAEIGLNEKFHTLTDLLNPIKKYQNEELAKQYKTEPYAMSADIYTNEYSYGRGGWSMYTGAAGWYYQLLVRYVLGIHFVDGEIQIKPNLPNNISSFHLEFNTPQKELAVEVKNDKRHIN